MYCVSNNGESMVSKDDDYTPREGEKLFDHWPLTENEMSANFPGRTDAIKSQKLATLQAEYNAYICKLGQDYAIAQAQGNITTAEDIASEMKDVLAQYAIDKAAING
jgi:hypothetical protein